MKGPLRTILLVVLILGLLMLAVPVRELARSVRRHQGLEDLRVGSTVMITYEPSANEDQPRRAIQIVEALLDETFAAGNQIKGTLKEINPRENTVIITVQYLHREPVDYTFTVDSRTNIVIGSEPELAQLSDLGAATILLMGGFRGLAVNVLWLRATALHEQRQYHEERALLDLISTLQPRYASVWVYQAWNISYNISVQYEGDREQYKWVKEGLDFLLRGDQVLPESADVALWLGIIYSHKFPQNENFIKFLEEDEGKNNYEEGAKWFDRSRKLIREGRTLAVFHPRVADSGVYHCYHDRYLQILERATVGPNGFDRKSLDDAEHWRMLALEEAKGLPQRWPLDPAFPTFAASVDAVPVDALVFHAVKALNDGEFSPEADEKARFLLARASQLLDGLMSVHTDKDGRTALLPKVEKIATCLPDQYLNKAWEEVDQWKETRMTPKSAENVRHYVARAGELLEPVPITEKTRKNYEDEMKHILDEVDKQLKASSTEGTNAPKEEKQAD